MYIPVNCKQLNVKLFKYFCRLLMESYPKHAISWLLTPATIIFAISECEWPGEKIVFHQCISCIAYIILYNSTGLRNLTASSFLLMMPSTLFFILLITRYSIIIHFFQLIKCIRRTWEWAFQCSYLSAPIYAACAEKLCQIVVQWLREECQVSYDFSLR